MRVALLAAALFAGACSAPPIDPAWREAAAKHHRPARLAQPQKRSTAESLLSGFDDPAAPGLTTADRVLFRIQTFQGDALRNEYYARFTVQEPTVRDLDGNLAVFTTAFSRRADGSDEPILLPYRLVPAEEPETVRAFETRVTRVLAEVFDGQGKPLSSHATDVGRKFMAKGLLAACQAAAARRAKAPLGGAYDSDIASAHHALDALLQIIRNDATLRSLMTQVARTPPLWSILRRFGVEKRVDPLFAEAREASDPNPDGAWILPVHVLGNDVPILLASFQIEPPRSPRTLCAGVTSIVIVHPGDDSTRIRVELCAARRGSKRR